MVQKFDYLLDTISRIKDPKERKIMKDEYVKQINILRGDTPKSSGAKKK